MVRKFLLICGILSTLYYVAMDIIVPLQYEGYNSASQTVSELSATGTPTRSPWVSCPTTIFTFGILLLSDKRFPFSIVVIPFVWTLIGFSAVLTFGIYEDTALLIAGVTTSIMILMRKKMLSRKVYKIR